MNKTNFKKLFLGSMFFVCLFLEQTPEFQFLQKQLELECTPYALNYLENFLLYYIDCFLGKESLYLTVAMTATATGGILFFTASYNLKEKKGLIDTILWLASCMCLLATSICALWHPSFMPYIALASQIVGYLNILNAWTSETTIKFNALPFVIFVFALCNAFNKMNQILFKNTTQNIFEKFLLGNTKCFINYIFALFDNVKVKILDIIYKPPDMKEQFLITASCGDFLFTTLYVILKLIN